MDDEELENTTPPEYIPNVYRRIRTSVTKDELMLQIRGSCGLIETLEKRLDCTRQAILHWVNSDPEVKEEMKFERERANERVLAATYRDAVMGSTKEKNKARELIFQIIAKERGLGVKRLEVTGANGAPMVMLHSPAPNTISRDQWVKLASEYSEQEKEKVDAQIKAAMSGKLLKPVTPITESTPDE